VDEFGVRRRLGIDYASHRNLHQGESDEKVFHQDSRQVFGDRCADGCGRLDRYLSLSRSAPSHPSSRTSSHDVDSLHRLPYQSDTLVHGVGMVLIPENG
jgi:hypothetical protein